ncbi:MAG: hypothetical protein BWY06_01762 [Candidatus Latescibacteria bacterium ADurb.Bin168]|nr:MAG: hypothetical protein BWY06_01762 [Candidatus Latescibacteria bacterium ADurb.Bin168]
MADQQKPLTELKTEVGVPRFDGDLGTKVTQIAIGPFAGNNGRALFHCCVEIGVERYRPVVISQSSAIVKAQLVDSTPQIIGVGQARVLFDYVGRIVESSVVLPEASICEGSVEKRFHHATVFLDRPAVKLHCFLELAAAVAIVAEVVEFMF